MNSSKSSRDICGGGLRADSCYNAHNDGNCGHSIDNKRKTTMSLTDCAVCLPIGKHRRPNGFVLGLFLCLALTAVGLACAIAVYFIIGASDRFTWAAVTPAPPVGEGTASAAAAAAATAAEAGLQASTRHLIVLARHGERKPLLPIAGRSPPFEPGVLTAYGRQSMRQLGETLRGEYAAFLDDDATQAFVLYANNSRCMESAKMIAAGMQLFDATEQPLPKPIVDNPADLLQFTRASLRAPHLLNETRSLLTAFSRAMPDCVGRIARQLLDRAAHNDLSSSGQLQLQQLQQVPEELEMLVSFLVADGIDTLRMQSTAAHPTESTTGLDAAGNDDDDSDDELECPPHSNAPLVNDEMFASFSKLCLEWFCRPPLLALLQELHYVRTGAPDKIVSIFGLSDVHIQALLMALQPHDAAPQLRATPPLRRPPFGAHLVLEVSLDSVLISYRSSPVESQQQRAGNRYVLTMPLSEAIQLLQAKLS